MTFSVLPSHNSMVVAGNGVSAFRKPNRIGKSLRSAHKNRILFLLAFALWLCPNLWTQDDYLIYDFSQPNSQKGWQVISQPGNSQTSTGNLESSSQGSIIFSGEMKKGIAGSSILMISPETMHRLRGYGGLSIRLKGDGKFYQMCLYNHTTDPVVSFQAGFNTRKERLDIIFLPFSSFIPYYQGHIVRDWQVLDQSKIVCIGFLVDDRQPGPFHLEILWIKAISL